MTGSEYEMANPMNEAGAGTCDEVFVVAAILGDLEAFDFLVARYRPAVVRAARAMVAAGDAEDVAQDALLLAFKALPSLEDPRKFPAWLHAITRRCAFRSSDRTRSRERRMLPLDEVILEQVPALSVPIPNDGRDEELARALEAIPGDYGMALRLHFLDEMPLKRIAGFLGISIATVKWRIFKGKRFLREQLEFQRGKRYGKRKGN
jgi:RNA polymerase sigma-70 factor, ECF subfamily